jgi:hypothetical protein
MMDNKFHSLFNADILRAVVSLRWYMLRETRNICTDADNRTGYFEDMQMKVVKATHREENDSTMVILRFKTRDQLLDPEDPSPLPHKELTQEAEDSIISNVFAFRLNKPITLEIQIPGEPDPGPAAEIIEAIRHHFRFVLAGHKRETGIFIRERRIALAFTLLNILIALLYAGYAFQHEGWMNSIAGTMIGAVVVIMNWATIWDTYEFFIFDGRQQMQRKKLLNKIIDSEIRVVPFRQDSEP